MYWIYYSYHAKSCFGPISIDIIEHNCSELLRYQKLTSDHYFPTFHEELLRLSAFFQGFKMHYIPTLIMLIFIHLISIGSGLAMFFGVLLKRKILLIPW